MVLTVCNNKRSFIRHSIECGILDIIILVLNPGPAGPVSIRIRYACLCGGLRIYPGSPGK